MNTFALIFDLLFLIPLFIISGICSYTDLKYGKIFNRWIGFGFLWGIFINTTLLLYNFLFLSQKSNIQYFLEVNINAVIAFFVGYFIWHFGLWSAGDAKLFALCAFLLPLKFYSKSYLSHFPSFNLLINLFVPLLFSLALSAFLGGIFEVYKKKREIKIQKTFNLKSLLLKTKRIVLKLLLMLLNYLFVSILFQRITLLKNFVPRINFLFNPISSFFSMFFVYSLISNIKKRIKWTNYLIGGTSILYCFYLFFFKDVETLGLILKQALFFMILVNFFRQTLNFYIERKETKRVKIKNVEKGMVIINKDISLILRELKRKKLIENFGKIKAEGLNKEQVKIIKKLFVNKLDLEIQIYKTFPFAPFMFLSVIVSILTNSSFVDFLLFEL